MLIFVHVPFTNLSYSHNSSVGEIYSSKWVWRTLSILVFRLNAGEVFDRSGGAGGFGRTASATPKFFSV